MARLTKSQATQIVAPVVTALAAMMKAVGEIGESLEDAEANAFIIGPMFGAIPQVACMVYAADQIPPEALAFAKVLVAKNMGQGAEEDAKTTTDEALKTADRETERVSNVERNPRGRFRIN
jgi:hypothetical protein